MPVTSSSSTSLSSSSTSSSLSSPPPSSSPPFPIQASSSSPPSSSFNKEAIAGSSSSSSGGGGGGSGHGGLLHPQPSRPPRGRNFDATVLNVYDDGSNSSAGGGGGSTRPRYSRSQSSQYRRSNQSSGHSSPRDRPSTPESGRGSGVGIVTGVNASSWRAAAAVEPRSGAASPARTPTPKPARGASRSATPVEEAEGGSRGAEAGSRSSPGHPSSLDMLEKAEDRLVGQLKTLTVSQQGATSDEGDKVKEQQQEEKQEEKEEEEEELEEWELAMQNSDEEAIPKLPATSDKKKPQPAKSKTASSATTTTTTTTTAGEGNVMGEDDSILELSNLAPSIKTVHVNDMLAPFANKAGGFRIKWIDDSRALVIFESAAVANQAFIATQSGTWATVAPYRGADRDALRRTYRASSLTSSPSSSSISSSSSSSTPSARPAKTDSVARRLVHGALGIRVRRTPEQIEQERIAMAAAREAREAARQERQRERQEMDAVFNQ
ncbi:hypothetical protein BGZ73_008340 [Actinomortierella ambigua]|nr:hypothetical protein BGZ73_008340 [Actinomortierella ambigua]